MKSAEDLLIEINAALRRTRDVALLALLGEIKEFLESPPPAQPRSPSLEPREGSLPPEEVKRRKSMYMLRYMRARRAKQREQKLAIINSTSRHPRTGSDITDIGESQADKTQSKDSEA